MNADIVSAHQAHAHADPRMGSAPAKTAAVAEGSRYTCPMHQEIVRDAPGNCPKCGMTSVPMLETAAPAASAKPVAGAPAAEYTCPMHPEVRSPAARQLPQMRHGAGAGCGYGRSRRFRIARSDAVAVVTNALRLNRVKL